MIPRVKKVKTKKARAPPAQGICCSLRLSVTHCTGVYEEWVLAAAHDGIVVINFTVSKRRENGNADFGKTAVGNALWGD